jgi:uncharacterized membrane protein YccC
VRSANERGLNVPDWLSATVPEWLTAVMRPKKVPVPWASMAQAVLAIWVPMAVAFGTGRRSLALLPAMGALLAVMIDTGGPFRPRVTRIAAAAVLGGAPGLLIGTLIHGRGWVAVGAVVVVAGVSSVMARLGAGGSAAGLQLFVYSALGLGALGALRPWWHTALEFLAGAAWAVVLIIPGYLLSPRSAERRAVAGVYYALARSLRAIGTPLSAAARTDLAGALNAAYDAMLTGRANASGRSRRDMHLLAVLNVSHQFAEATATLRSTGERVPPLIPEEIDRLADAIGDGHGPGSGPLGRGGRPVPASGGLVLPAVPPPWSPSAGGLALRDALVSLERVLSGNWAPPAFPEPGRPGLAARGRAWAENGAEQLLGGRIAWEFTLRLMICTGVAATLSEVLPLTRSYWLVLTVGIILKPDYGSVFARAVQRGVGTVAGAVLGAVILVVTPYGPWLLLPFGLFAALLPYAKARNFGLAATFLTPLVVLLIDLLAPAGWRLAEDRLIDTVLASAVVLLVGYAPWPSAWQAHLPGQFAGALRAVSAYADEALVTTPAARIAATGTARAPGRDPGAPPPPRSRLRRRTYRALSNLRAEFQRTMSEPTRVSRRAAVWWPAVVALEEVMDAVTATVVAIGRGAPVPSASAVHALTGALRAVADAIEADVPPHPSGSLPGDPALEAVTAAVRSVLGILAGGAGVDYRSKVPSNTSTGRESTDDPGSQQLRVPRPRHGPHRVRAAGAGGGRQPASGRLSLRQEEGPVPVPGDRHLPGRRRRRRARSHLLWHPGLVTSPGPAGGTGAVRATTAADRAMAELAGQLTPSASLARIDTVTARAVTTVTVIGLLLTGLGALGADQFAKDSSAATALAVATVLVASLAVASALVAQVLTITRGLNPANLRAVEAWYRRQFGFRAWATQVATVLLIVAALLAGATAATALLTVPGTVSPAKAASPAKH